MTKEKERKIEKQKKSSKISGIMKRKRKKLKAAKAAKPEKQNKTASPSGITMARHHGAHHAHARENIGGMACARRRSGGGIGIA